MKKYLIALLVMLAVLGVSVFAAPTSVETFETPDETNIEFGVPGLFEPEEAEEESAELMATYGDLFYSVSDGKVAIALCLPSVTSITIPSEIDGYPVTSIDSRAFRECTSLVEIVIPDSVTNIGEAAFSGCTSLKSVKIGNGVTSIGDYAFQSCRSLESVEIGVSVTNIGDRAFDRCSNLKKIYITDLGAWCNIDFFSSESTPMVYADNLFLNGELLPKDVVIPENATQICDYAFYGQEHIKSVTIPHSVTSIGYEAFSGCTSLESVKIGNGVTSIGEYAFSNCMSLESVEIPDGVKHIGECAFYPNRNMSTVHFYGSAPTLDAGVFPVGQFVIYYIPEATGFTTPAWNGYPCYPMGSVIEDYSTLDENDFNAQGIYFTLNVAAKIATVGDLSTNANNSRYPGIGDGHVVIPEKVIKNGVEYRVQNIGQYAFYYNRLVKSVTIPSTVASVGQMAFVGMRNNAEFIVSKDNRVFSADENGVLFNKNRTNLIAFPAGSGFSSFTVPDSVATINKASFAECDLEEITIPFIGSNINDSSNSFSYIFGTVPYSLKRVNISGGNITHGAFYNDNGIQSVSIGDRVNSIENDAFYCCDSLESITIGTGVTSISTSAFHGCKKLKSVYISDLEAWCNISFIPDYDFYEEKFITDGTPFYHEASLYLNGEKVENLIIPASITKINDYSFYKCKSIQSVSLNNVTSTGDYAFAGCSNIEKIVIPDVFTLLGKYSFSGCSNLADIVLPNGITSISEYAFSDCSSLSDVVIPDSVTSIGAGAFSGCSRFESVLIPDSVVSIGIGAFYGCSNIEEITLPFVGSGIGSYGSSSVFGFIFDYKMLTNSNESGATYQYSEYDYRFSRYYYYYYYIPDSLKKVTLTKTSVIENNSFMNCKNIVSIIIPDSVTRIGEYAFCDCTSLTSIEIPNNLCSIGNSAFSGCKSLESIVIPDSVTRIGEYAFSHCTSFEFFEIPDSVKTIGSNAFNGCTNLKEIIVGKGVTSMDLSGTPALERIDVSPENTVYASDNSGVLYNKDMTTLIQYPVARGWPYYNIAEGTKTIGYYAFDGCSNLFSILIPSSVTSIDSYSIRNCGNATLYVYDGTAGHQFAENSGMNYVLIDGLTLSWMEILSLPYATEYVKGTTFDFDGLYVIGYYDSYYATGLMTEITNYQLIYDNTKVGDQTVVVKYGDFECTFDIYVRDVLPTGIAITSLPEKIYYVLGDEFTSEGLTVNMLYEDGTSTPVTNFTLTTPDMNASGTKTVTVTSGEFTTQFEIVVVDVVNDGKLVNENIPDAPELVYYDSGKVELGYDDGVEYSHDGEHWQSSNVFNGLNHNTEYNFYVRYPETETHLPSEKSESLTVKTKYQISGYISVAGYFRAGSTLEADVETMLIPEATVTYQWMCNGEPIEGKTEKTFVLTDEYFDKVVSVSVTAYGEYFGTLTSKGRIKNPEKPVLESRTVDTLTLKAVDGCEYSCDGGKTWQTSNVFENLAIGSTYNLCMRYVETDMYEVTEKSVMLELFFDRMENENIPELPTLVYSDSSVVELSKLDGVEYSIDGEHWQSSPVFNNLTHSVEYIFFVRFAQTDTHKEGKPVEALRITLEKGYVTGELNEDGVIDMNDAILLLQYSMFPELFPLEYAGNLDFTNDGNVDMNDAILLLQHSMFPDLYPIE